MYRDNQQFMRRVVILGIFTLILILSLIIYSARNNPYAPLEPAASYSPPITNAVILQNWIPTGAYKYTLSRIYDYLQANRIQVSTLTIKGNVAVDESEGGAYDFTVLLEPQNQTHNISVMINNINGIISNSVSIDGKQQGYLVPTQNSNGTQFSGFDNLISDGVTDLQAQELQAAFQKFDANAKSVSVGANSISLPAINPNNPSLTNTYGFLVYIDGKIYQAKLNLIGINQVELFLIDSQTNKQVFDSGVFSQN